MDKIGIQNYDKYVGAIIGAATGDALGWPNEQNSKNLNKNYSKEKDIFQKWTRRDGGRFWPHNEEIYPGEYSDDTQLIIATARSLRYDSGWSKYFTRVELPAWLSYERGGGGATKRAAEAWSRGNSPWNPENQKIKDIERYFNAGGNGVAMRILPLLFGNEGSWEEISRQVFLNGIFTHGHPRALIGALVYADALLYFLDNTETLGYGELVEFLLQRKDKWIIPTYDKLESWKTASEVAHKGDYIKTWNNVIEEVINLLTVVKKGLSQGALDMGDDVLQKIGCFDKNVNGAGTVSTVAAIYLASKYASSPRLALTEVANLKNADTDTLASMVGGLLGMLHGSEFLSGSGLEVQDYKFLKGLVYRQVKSDNNIKGPLFNNNPEIKQKLKKMRIGDCIEASPFGQLNLKDKRINKPSINGITVYTLKLISEEGQSIFVKTFERMESKDEATLSDKEISQIKQRDSQSKMYMPEVVEKADSVFSLNSMKIRGLVNILPSNLKSEMCLLFYADVMEEIERRGNNVLQSDSILYLLRRWEKHSIMRSDIENAIRIILEY